DLLVAAGGLEVARGGEDRVDRVVGVALAVLVRVDAVGLPGGRHELHPAEGAGGGDVEVAPVVGLDLVDRGEDLPADAVLDAGGLVDRQQERRDAELLDEEVRHADRRRAGQRQREGRVVRGGRAARRARGRLVLLDGVPQGARRALDAAGRTLNLVSSLAVGLAALLLRVLLGLPTGGLLRGGRRLALLLVGTGL